MAARPQVVFLAICSGDPELIGHWTASGDLPNLARFLQSGVVGRQTGLPGVYVGAHWPSWITGCHPGRHGVHSWRQLTPGTYDQFRCRAAEQLQRPPFWEALSAAGRRLCLLDIPHSGLSAHINGVQTVEWGAHDANHGFHASSRELATELTRRFGRHPVPGDSDAMLDLEDPWQLRDTLVRGVAMKRDLTRYLYARERWDFFAQVFTEAHCGGHLLWNVHDRDYRWHGGTPEGAGDPLKDVYVAIDQALGAILTDIGEDTTVILLANHGMGAKANMAHLFDRVLVGLGYAAPAAPIQADHTWRDRVDGPLTRGWQALPESLRDRLDFLRTAKRRLVNPEQAPPPVIDPAAGRVFTVTNNTAHGAIRVNLRGREPAGRVAPGLEYENLLDELSAELLSLVNMATGAPVVDGVYRCDEHYPGPARDRLPDLFVQFRNAGPVVGVCSPRLGTVTGEYTYVRSGEHRPDGLFAIRAPGLRPGRIKSPVRCMDFAPTIAAMLDVELPGEIDGRVIEGVSAGQGPPG